MQKNSYIGWIPTVRSETDLYEKVSANLKFPYFGVNWDALIDMYRDFEWIDQEGIVMIHEGLAKLPIDDLERYIEIVLRCLDYWIHYPSSETQVDTSQYTEWELAFDVYQPHTILFVFPKNEEKRIMEFINKFMHTLSFERNLKIDEL